MISTMILDSTVKLYKEISEKKCPESEKKISSGWKNEKNPQAENNIHD